MEYPVKRRGWTSLPHECTAIILGYLEHDTFALAALAQVDRAFFRWVCPILYRDPFERLEQMARVLSKPAIEIAQDQLEAHRLQPAQCCEHAKVTERVLTSLAAPTKTKAHEVPGYLDPAAVFAASPAVAWRYEALYRTLMEPILQVLHATYPSLHWPFLVHQHIRQLPMYDIPEEDALLATAAVRGTAVLSKEEEEEEEEEDKDDTVMDEELFDQNGNQPPPCGGFDLGDDNDDNGGHSSSHSGDEQHTSTMGVKKRDYLQYLRVIDLAYFPTRYGGHHRHYTLHGPYQRVMLGHHSRFHSTNPTNAKIHRDYGLLYCIWDRSPKAIAFQHSLQKVYSPQSGVLDKIQRLLLARYPRKVQALRLPIRRLTAFDLDPALFSAMAHRTTLPTPMPSRSAFIARRMTHLSRIEIHGLSHAAEDWYKLREGLAYLAAIGDPIYTIRELSIRSSGYKVCDYWMQRVLTALPKLEVLEAHGISEGVCMIHSGIDYKQVLRVWSPRQQQTDQHHHHYHHDGQLMGHSNKNETQESSGLRPWVEVPSNSQGTWTDSKAVSVPCECHWLSTWSAEHGQALRVLDLESEYYQAIHWRQYTDLARFPNLEELRLVGRDQDMFEWVLEGREQRRQQQRRSRSISQPKYSPYLAPATTTTTSTNTLMQQQQKQPTALGTLDRLKRLSLLLHDDPYAGVLTDRCNAIFGEQLEELVLVRTWRSAFTRAWRFWHPFSKLRRLAIRDYTLDTFDVSCLGPQTCPVLEELVLRYVVERDTMANEDLMRVQRLGTLADMERADRHVAQSLVPALKGLTRLRALWLEGTWYMTVKAVSGLVSELGQLRTLGLQACPNITASSTELKCMVAELRAKHGGPATGQGLMAASADHKVAEQQSCANPRPLELRWINTDLPGTHSWFWQDTKILYR